MATNATLMEFLTPQVILRVVSRIRNGQGALGRWLGFQPSQFNNDTVTLSGPNTLPGPTRQATFRIFDNTRVVAKGRAPGTGPATVAQNPMGQVNIECARFHIKIPLLYEQLGNQAIMVGPNSQIDEGGQDYIRRQEQFIQRQFNMMIEMMAAGMMRDSLYFRMLGDNWLPTFTDPSTQSGQVGFQIPFQIPSGNKSQLNMLGTGAIITTTWTNLAAPIFDNLSAIEAAYAQLSGYSMTDVWINSILWNSIIQNTQIRNIGGSANTVYAEWDREPETYSDGQPGNKYVAVLRALPHIRWHINNDAIALNTDVDPSYSTAPSGATLAKLIPDTMAIFCTEASSDWSQLYLGSEYVVENPGMPGMRRSGWYYWSEYTTQPSAIELIGLLNAIPLLYIPKVIAPATVVF